MSFPFAQMATTVAALQRGAYDRTCYVQRHTATPDAGGFPVKAWATIAEDVPCSVKDVSLDEALRAGQLDAQALTRVKLDASPDFTPTAADRIVLDDGAVLTVEAEPEDVHGAGRWWHLTCRRATGGGA